MKDYVYRESEYNLNIFVPPCIFCHFDHFNKM